MAPLRALAALACALLADGCASPGAQQCLINTDCKLGSYCFLGSCRIDCRADRDCSAGTCDLTLGKCTGVADGGVADSSAPRDFSTGAPDFATADMTMLGRYGDVCAMGAQCASTYCSVNPFAPADHECTGDCNAGCMLGDFCVANTTCAQSDIGRPCNLGNGGSDCRAGACLGGSGPAFCTRLCNSSADCPGGFPCSAAPNSNQRVCVDVDATGACVNDGQCAYGTHCDVANARCLGDCRNGSDCPLFHKCLNGLCYPNAATGRGGLNALCNTANDCRTGACLAGRCLGACSVLSAQGQWCPGGWGCNPISDGNGGWILGCLNAGANPLGTACATNADCASGLCVDQPGYCSRFCNSAPCPSVAPKCAAVGVVADGINLMACSK